MQKAGVKKEDFAGPLLSAFSHQGKTYGIPKDFNTLGLVYNKELFQKAGVKEPTNDWTWEDLKAAAKALAKDGVVGLSLPAAPGSASRPSLRGDRAGAFRRRIDEGAT